MEKVSVFLPVRGGSERIINKNIRKFSVFSGGILELKLKELQKLEPIVEIVLSTDDEKAIEIAKPFSKNNSRIRIERRPGHLATSQTNLTDLVKHAGEVCNGDHILWTHTTSPFLTAKDYELAINCYFENLQNGYDSLMTVRKFQNFLWDKSENDIINRINHIRWPRTQDLKELYEIDSGIFIADKECYKKGNDRVGNNPFLKNQHGFKSFDIDWNEDFDLAELIYEKYYI